MPVRRENSMAVCALAIAAFLCGTFYLFVKRGPAGVGVVVLFKRSPAPIERVPGTLDDPDRDFIVDRRHALPLYYIHLGIGGHSWSLSRRSSQLSCLRLWGDQVGGLRTAYAVAAARLVRPSFARMLLT
jgi:hypothetical protein